MKAALKLNNKLSAALIIATAVLVFGSGLLAGFVWDDEYLVLRREGFNSDWSNLKRIPTMRDVANPADETPYYRPFTAFAYFLQYHAWGLRPFGYHLMNVILHALVGVLFYFLVLRTFGERLPALFSALIFTVHPVTAEVVNFVSAMNNMLAASLMLGALLVITGARGGGVGRVMGVGADKRRTALSLLLFSLALLSKEPAVVLPLFMLLWALAAAKDSPGRAGLGTVALFFLVTAAYFLIRLLVLGAFTSDTPAAPGASHAGLVAASLYEYARLLVFPLKLSALYTVEPAALVSLKSAVAVAFVLALCALAIKSGRNLPLRWGALWLIFGLLPVVNLIPIPSAPVAERYLYIPSLGFALLAGWTVWRLYEKKAALGLALFLVIFALLTTRTLLRNPVWADSPTLYRSMAEAEPENAVARVLVGVELKRAGKPARALREFQTAILLNPQSAEAYSNMGRIYYVRGDFVPAAAAFSKALSLKPSNYKMHFDLALALEQMDKSGLALEHYRAFTERAGVPVDEAFIKMLKHAKWRIAEIEKD